MRRPPRAFIVLIIAALAPVLAGCAPDSAAPTAVPATRAPSQPPVVTRIVPPPTPTPLPTLPPEVRDALGEWALRITLEVTGWEFVDRLSYFGAATFTVDEQGAIAGSGYFTSTLDGGRCLAQALDEDPLTFRVSGSVDASGSGTRAVLTLLPDQRFLPETFHVMCPDDLGGVPEHRAPVLWPALSDLNLLTWDVTLETGQRLALAGDLTAAATGLSGTLVGEVQVRRR